MPEFDEFVFFLFGHLALIREIAVPDQVTPLLLQSKKKNYQDNYTNLFSMDLRWESFSNPMLDS